MKSHKHFFTLDNEVWFWLSAVLLGVCLFALAYGVVDSVIRLAAH